MVDIIDGEKVEYYLCKECIDKTQAYMFDIPSLDLSKYSVDSLCKECGMTWADFTRTQRLQCPNDYIIFRDKLIPVLNNYHKNSEHVGKRPVSSVSISDLKRQMADAIKKEDYETAAILRDKIKNMGDL